MRSRSQKVLQFELRGDKIGAIPVIRFRETIGGEGIKGWAHE